MLAAQAGMLLSFVSNRLGATILTPGHYSYTQKVHIYNNYYVTVLGHAIDPEVRAFIPIMNGDLIG